jgi:hypothetical protein
MSNPPPALAYREKDDGAIVQVLDLGSTTIEVPIERGSEAEAFMLRLGVRVP